LEIEVAIEHLDEVLSGSHQYIERPFLEEKYWGCSLKSMLILGVPWIKAHGVHRAKEIGLEYRRPYRSAIHPRSLLSPVVSNSLRW
jgi:hypothetical protein